MQKSDVRPARGKRDKIGCKWTHEPARVGQDPNDVIYLGSEFEIRNGLLQRQGDQFSSDLNFRSSLASSPFSPGLFVFLFKK